MAIMFNTILREAGLQPHDVRLIRHKDNSASRGRTPYDLWRNDRPKFEQYQSTQNTVNRKKFVAPYWAAFIVDYQDNTMFAGLYSAKRRGLLAQDTPQPHKDGMDIAGNCDVYDLALLQTLGDLIGKLFIDWGAGALAWVQYAERHDKIVTELRKSSQEPEFPGFLYFIQPLSSLDRLPNTWITALRSSRGIYLLTCPKTKEQYVGSATGPEGFWGRWQDYIQTGHGGNAGLKSREPSDYQVSILEVAGTSCATDDILSMEGRWQRKLQSCEMGLNRNLAGRAV